MTKVITTNNGQQYQTAGVGKTAGAVYVGSLASGAIAGAANLGSLACMNKMQKLAQSCDTVELRNAINDTFKGGALPGKGVEIIDVVTPKEGTLLPENFIKLFTKEKSLSELHPENKKLVEAIENAIPKFMKKSPLGAMQAEILINTFENGKNACFLPKGNKIIVNIEKLGTSAFHEMGHAINYNFSTFWKGMQKLRGPMKYVGGLLATTALFKRKKVEGEEPKNGFDKVTTFIKNNVGKLVTLSFVPMVAEELMATFRGNKMAAKVLSPEMLKKVKMSNALGAATYITAAIATGLGASVASKVRDKIAKPKQIA